MEFKNNVHPTKEQMEGFLEGDTDTPIAMVNLLKFKEKAEYEDGRDSDLTGEEAYAIYAKEVLEHLKKVGWRMVFWRLYKSSRCLERWKSFGTT
jgi:hypothetical protein